MARILIAEDDKAMRVFLDRALSHSGHDVNAVPSGDTAARYVENEPFDLLVMDIDMPGMNGVDLARQVLAKTPGQAILFVTGFAARALEALDFEWLEAPFWDTDLEGYRELNRRTDLRIIPAGNWILAPQLLDHALRTGCWSSARFDVTVAGGFTQSNKLMGVAAAHGAKVEVQCWGYTLTHAANLHLILANENAGYFEQPVEYGPYEFGAIDVIRTDAQGYVHAPDGPGLGVRMDWEAIEAASFLTYEVTGKD